MVARHLIWLISLVGGLLVGCATHYALSQLSDEEQGYYRAYRHIMTPRQLRTYIKLPTAAERADYARQVGASGVLESLPEAERTAVLAGQPFKGMSAQALRLLWGEPYYWSGPPAYQRWYYYGDYFSLAEYGSSQTNSHTVMEVYLIDGKVEWWQDRIPSDREDKRFPSRRLFHHFHFDRVR